MKAVLSFTTITLMVLSLKWADAACQGCMSEAYEKRKGTVETLLDFDDSGTSSVIVAGLLNSAAGLLSDNDQATFSALLTDIQTNVVENADYTNTTKLIKTGLKFDQFFINNPVIEDAMRYQIISEWGPLCDFLFIIDEMNVENFWKLSSTPGTATSCLLYDVILEAAKPVKFIKWKLYLESIPCSISWNMALHVLNLHHDIPEGKYRLYLQSLELPGYDMTVNQVQRVARSYYSSKALTCRRLRDTFANYPASQLLQSQNFHLAKSLNKSNTAGLASSSSLQLCIELVSGQIATDSTVASYIQVYNKIFWNFPFGSLYDNIIYNDCQIKVLKEKAPIFYN